MTRPKKSYVVCLKNKGYEAALELRKLYVALGIPDSEERGFVRIIDESGEDYLYPKALFEAIEVPSKVARALAASA